MIVLDSRNIETTTTKRHDTLTSKQAIAAMCKKLEDEFGI